MNSTLFFNGNILTQDPSQPTAESVLVENDKIKLVGRQADLLPAISSSTQLFDLNSSTLLPGFHDAHIHVWKVGHLLTYMLDLRGVGSIRELQEKLAAFAQKTDSQWVLGRGFNEANLAEQRLPTRSDIDEAVPDRPVWLIRTCAHVAVANSKALELAGITEQTQAPFGGAIGKDERGRLTGIFSETALGLVANHIPPPTENEYRQMILAACQKLRSLGVTAATDPAVVPDLLAVYQKMALEDALSIRLDALAIRLPDGGKEALPLPEKFYHPFFRCDGVKFFADGGMSGATAALRRTYRGGKNKGILRLDPAQFFALANEAFENGFRIGTHAIGDAALDLVIDIYQKLASFSDVPNVGRVLNPADVFTNLRIEHVGLPTRKHLKIMAKHGIMGIFQPIFLAELGLNFRRYLPLSYLNKVYPIRQTLDAGVQIALSTDAPVVGELRPFLNIKAAMLRQDANGEPINPAESISMEEALFAYTMGSAGASGEAENRGSITPGKWADLVVWSGNPLKMKVEELERLKPEAVFVAGEKVFGER